MPLPRKQGRPRKKLLESLITHPDDKSQDQESDVSLITNKRYQTRSRKQPNYEESELSSDPEEVGSAKPLPSVKQPSLFGDGFSDNDLGSLLPVSEAPDNADDSWSFLSWKEYIVDTKDHIQSYAGNVAYFVNNTGKPLDEGARISQQRNKVPIDMVMMVSEIHEFKRKNNKRYFAICIEHEEHPCSMHIKRVDIYRSLTVLRDLLIK